MDALRSYSITNLTPLTLGIDIGGRSAATLEPGEEGRVSRPPSAKIGLSDTRSGYRFAELGAEDPASEIRITPDMVRRGDSTEKTAVDIVNATDQYCEICWRDQKGTLQRSPKPLAPGESRRFSGHVHGVLEFRSSFTGDLVDLFVLAADDKQQAVITSRYLDSLARAVPLQPLVPWAGKLELIGGLGPEPKADSRDYIAIADYESARRPIFNGATNVVTRSVTISGVTLRWKAGDEAGLMAWNGVADVENLEIVADRVIVAAPLHFPGTNLTIRARVLEFEDGGATPSSIDITPRPFLARAASPTTADGKYPADAAGNPVYRGKDGFHGQDCGTLSILVGEIILPEGSTAPRFMARGGDGQAAEPGGIRPYVKAKDDHPSDGKDLSPVTATAIGRKFENTMPIAKRCDNWRWPGEVDWQSKITHNGRVLFYDEGANQGSVTSLRLFAIDESLFSQDLNIMFFPTGEHVHHTPSRPALLSPEKEYKETKLSQTRPGDGEDAYPGGAPGNGGRGGEIVCSLALDETMRDVSGGGPGEKTPAVKGQRAGNPNPAYRVTMSCVKRTPPIESTIAPRMIEVEEVTAKAGADAAERVGRKGDAGSVTRQGTACGFKARDGRSLKLPAGDARAWMDPVMVDAVLRCAKDMFRNGYRHRTRALIEPYLIELRLMAGDASELSQHLTSFEAMAGNLKSDLDYFGHPPGWVPRLQALSNFLIYKEVRKTAMEILHFARLQLDAYDRRDAAAVRTDGIATELSRDIDSRRGLLEGAYRELIEARQALADIEPRVSQLGKDIDDLRKEVADDVEASVQAQRIFKGLMKLAGGAMQAIPVGQPYLGLAGGVVSSVGDFDWNQKNPLTQAGDILGKIGGHVDDFIKENKDLIVEDRSPSPDNATELRSLEDQISSAKMEMNQEQQRHKQAAKDFDKSWKDGREATLTSLRSSLKAWQEDIDALTAKHASSANMTDAEKKALADATREKERLTAALGEHGADTVFREREETIRQIKMLEAQAAAYAERKKDAEKTRIGAEKKALEAYADKLEKLEAEQKEALVSAKRSEEDTTKARAETKKTLQRLKTLGTGIGGIGEGIAVLAAPVGPDDPEVQSIVRDILDPSADIGASDKRRAKYAQLIKNLDEVRVAQQTAVRRLLQTQQSIAGHNAAIAQGVAALSDLSRRTQRLSGVQDVRIKHHLQGMAMRARDAIQWSLYHFIMAFRYEFLMDVSPDMLRIDDIIDAIAKAAGLDPKGDLSALHAIPAADYAAIEEKVLKDQLLDLALKLIAPRESQSPPVIRELACPNPIEAYAGAVGADAEWSRASRIWLETLRRERVIWLNPVADLRLVPDYRARGLRIRNVNLREIKLDIPPDHPPVEFTLRFLHTGVSIIYDMASGSSSGKYYYFTKGPQDDAFSWAYRCRWEGDGSGGKVTFKQDQQTSSSMIATLLGQKELTLAQYNPGGYSDLGIVIDYGFQGPQAFPPIKRLDLGITAELTADSPAPGRRGNA